VAPVRPSLLVLRALGLGDFLTGVPALRAVRRALPGHELVLATAGVLQPLVELAGVADRVLDVDGLEPVPWCTEPPEVAVNLHGRGPQSHQALTALRPGRLVAFGCPEASHAGPQWRAEEHEVRRWCRLVEESLHVPVDPRDLGLPVPALPAPAPGAVVVHPGAAYPARRWPADRFAAVARAVASTGYDVVVTGGPGEVRLAEEVRRGAGLPGSAVLAGRTGLTELAAQVASARLLVSGDTGAAHLASAFSTPSVLVFGPTPPSRWGPPAEGPHTVLWHGDGTGDPWGDEPGPALMRVEVDEVLAAARCLLGRVRRPGRPARRTTPGSA
jgi:ADP-heptose:LPS heptosyltransferase